MSAVSLSPRVTWLIARRLTTTERCTCANCAGSSCGDQFLQRRADQRLAGLARVVAPGDQRVLLVGAQVVDVVDRDQAQGLSDLSRGSSAAAPEPRRSAAARAAPRAAAAAPRCSSAGCAACSRSLQARHGLGQARRLHRLHQVVEHALREGLHRVLVVRGDEHQVRAAADDGAPPRRRTGPACARRESRRRAAAPRTARWPRGRCAPARPRPARARPAPAGAPAPRAAAARRRRSVRSGAAAGHAAAPACRESPARRRRRAARCAVTRSCASPPKASCRRSRSVERPVPSPLPARLQARRRCR